MGFHSLVSHKTHHILISSCDEQHIRKLVLIALRMCALWEIRTWVFIVVLALELVPTAIGVCPRSFVPVEFTKTQSL